MSNREGEILVKSGYVSLPQPKGGNLDISVLGTILSGPLETSFYFFAIIVSILPCIFFLRTHLQLPSIDYFHLAVSFPFTRCGETKKSVGDRVRHSRRLA